MRHSIKCSNILAIPKILKSTTSNSSGQPSANASNLLNGKKNKTKLTFTLIVPLIDIPISKFLFADLVGQIVSLPSNLLHTKLSLLCCPVDTIGYHHPLSFTSHPWVTDHWISTSSNELVFFIVTGLLQPHWSPSL